MENVKKAIVLILTVAVVSSCLFDRRPKDVDPFYTTKNFGQFPVMPLIKPIKLLQDDQSLEWNIDMLDYSFGHVMGVNNLDRIGVENTYVYCKTDSKKRCVGIYEKGDYVFLHKFNSISSTSTFRKPQKDEIQIYPLDSLGKTFTLPERWFVINVADSTTEAFFSKAKYDEYLKEKGVSGKMYNIDKYHKQFVETGILPWFPDSVKVKLRK